MTLGQKLQKLRVNKGITQKALAEALHVSFQTVSKWENDENEPDFNTIKKLAKIYGCSIDYLFSEEEEYKEKESPQQVVIHSNLHVCERCNKDIPENDLYVDVRHRSHTSGRRTHSSTTEHFFHTKCFEEYTKGKEALEAKYRKQKGDRARRLSFGWGIGGGVAALVIALIVFFAVPYLKQNVHPGLSVLFSVLIGYFVFSLLYCVISGSYIEDVLLGVSSWSIRFPGLIFSFSIDGFAWFIAMKILFAILGFLAGIAAVILAVAISGILAMVSFPFVLAHNIQIKYVRD